MIDWVSAVRPHIPRPCTTRHPMRKGTEWARPAATEPATKTSSESWTSSFLLNRSDNLPQIGVLTVVASRLAVMTQVYWRWVPWRSPMIVGRAVETIVLLSMAVNRPASSPVIASRIWRWVISPVGSPEGEGLLSEALREGAVVTDINGSRDRGRRVGRWWVRGRWEACW